MWIKRKNLKIKNEDKMEKFKIENVDKMEKSSN